MGQYTSTRAQPRVLVVDDAPEVLLLVRGILESEDFQVETAQDAAEAMGCLQQEPIDLIVLDLDLPDIQGTTLCRQLRHEGNSVPIVMLTSHNQDMERVAGLDCGADDYMGKPFLPEELLARVRAQLRRQVTFQERAEDLLRSQWHRIQAGVKLTQRNQRPHQPGRVSNAVRHLPVGRIGGDFFLLEEVDAYRTAVVVADAMGKGLTASLIMSSALSHTYELIHDGKSPREILGGLNNLMAAELGHLGTFVAMFCGLIDERSGEFTFASAGLEPPLWLRLHKARGRRHRKLSTGGVPVGVVPEFEYAEQKVRPAPGDQLFVFTDGLSDSVPVDRQSALMRRFYRILLDRYASVPDKVDSIMRRLRRESAGELTLRDDLTFLLLEFP